MKKIFVQKNVQYGLVSYCGSCDARILSLMAYVENSDENLRYQRLLKQRKVDEICRYVSGGDGIMPGAVILGTRFPDKLAIKTLPLPQDGLTLYYIEVPETPQEKKEYIQTVDVLDGQHRLFAFSSNEMQLDSEVVYDIPFLLFPMPDINLKRKLFLAANEKQDKPTSNLLFWYRGELSGIDEKDRAYQYVVNKLDKDADSPLRGRIIHADEVIKKGYKVYQIAKIIRRAKLFELRNGSADVTPDELVKIIEVYLRGWESACNVSFREPEKGVTITKIAGIRYMLYLLPYIWNNSLRKNIKFSEEIVQKALFTLAYLLNLDEPALIFATEDYNYAFRGEGATVKLALTHGKKLESYWQDELYNGQSII